MTNKRQIIEIAKVTRIESLVILLRKTSRVVDQKTNKQTKFVGVCRGDGVDEDGLTLCELLLKVMLRKEVCL